MFNFFKRNKNVEVPEWAYFFNKQEYGTFLKVIDNYFKGLDCHYELGNGKLIVDENRWGFGILGLLTLAQSCKQNKIGDYKEMMHNHFNAIIRTHEFGKEFDKIQDNFELVKEYIGVRLYPLDYVLHNEKNTTVGLTIVDDLYAMLIFDLPDALRSIKKEVADKWNQSFEVLFALGLENVNKKHSYIISIENFQEFSIWFVKGEHFFVPNIIFELKNRPDLLGPKGALIGIPHRHAVIIYPIENLEVVRAIKGLIPTICSMYQEGPGSISSKLFWYHDGQFENLPYEFDSDDNIIFSPPENFTDILKSLSAT